MSLPSCLSGKESTCNARDGDLIPGPGRSPGEGYGNPLQYSFLGSPKDRGVWWNYSSWGQKMVRHDLVTNNSKITWNYRLMDLANSLIEVKVILSPRQLSNSLNTRMRLWRQTRIGILTLSLSSCVRVNRSLSLANLNVFDS